METNSGQLNEDQRRQLLDALLSIPAFDTFGARSLLLTGLGNLPFNRAEGSKREDLSLIIDGAERLGRLNDGMPVLLKIVDAALFAAEGTQPGQALARLREALATPRRAGVVLQGGSGPVRGLALAPDGRQAVTWSLTRVLDWWNLTAGGQPRPIGVPLTGVTALALVPAADGALRLWIATCMALQCWDIGTERRIGEWLCPDHLITAFSFAPDSPGNTELLVGTQGGTVARAALAAGELVIQREFLKRDGSPAHSSEVVAILINPDNLFFSTTKNSVRQWSPSTYRERAHWLLPKSWIIDVALLPDGQHIVYSEGTEGKEAVRLWNLGADRVACDLVMPAASTLMTTVAAAADGRIVAAGTNDGALYVWTLPDPFTPA
jgi:WD40 repeat protein